MKFSTQPYVSSFIESQFPLFYKEYGQNFIDFMTEYYRWLEQTENPIGAARKLYDYRDIDNTEDAFLSHYQKKYLYGIPYNVAVNLRFLLKHVQDLYKSKGAAQSFTLLFTLIYGVSSKVYVPKYDILRASDGTWVQPKYLEVAFNTSLSDYVGYTINGRSSRATATVESFCKEAINGNIINTLYISNILPSGSYFIPGEQLFIGDVGVTVNTIANSTTVVLGSLYSMNVATSSPGFSIGNIIAVSHYDPNTGQIISNGEDALLRVVDLQSGSGQLALTIINGGYGFTTNSTFIVYRGAGDTTGTGANVVVSGLSFVQSLQYNTDILYDYANTALNAATYGFPSNPSGNLSSTWASLLSFANNNFGTITDFDLISAGQDYDVNPKVFVKATLVGKFLPGNVVYTTSSNVVTFTGSSPDIRVPFSNGDFIYLQANSSNAFTGEYHAISSITNSSSLILYGYPNRSSTSSAHAALAPNVLTSQFPINGPVLAGHNSLNAVIQATTSFGADLIGDVSVVRSGKGYLSGESLTAFLYASITTPLIVASGNNYVNGDQLVFTGGGTNDQAAGTIQTNNTGGVTFLTMSSLGSGYSNLPTMQVASQTGNGCVLQTTIQYYNTNLSVKGQAIINGSGIGVGYWSTTKGFLNADKYVEDDYYYQDFSYEIQAPLTLGQYANVLYKTFHPSGAKLFGKFLSLDVISSPATLLLETANT